MAADSVVRARIDERTKRQAAKVFADHGLTISDAIRIVITRAAKEKVLPFSPNTPNEVTLKAMRDAEAGKVFKAKDVKELLRQLNLGN